MKTLVLAAALGFFIFAPAPAPAAAARQAPPPVWPLMLSGVAAGLWVARRRLGHAR